MRTCVDDGSDAGDVVIEVALGVNQCERRSRLLQLSTQLSSAVSASHHHHALVTWYARR